VHDFYFISFLKFDDFIQCQHFSDICNFEDFLPFAIVPPFGSAILFVCLFFIYFDDDLKSDSFSSKYVMKTSNTKTMYGKIEKIHFLPI